MLSLAYSFISLAFQINFFGGVPNTGDGTQVTPNTDGYKNANAYGHGAFPVYWMLNFFGTLALPRARSLITESDYVRVTGMIALGLACENVAMLVGQPW